MLFGVVGTLISFIIISLGSLQLFKKLGIDFLDTVDYLALGAIFSATDSVCTLQVLNQEETPFLYSLVFGEGVVNDATAVVLFNAIQRFDLSHITSSIALQLFANFLYLFVSSTVLGVAVGLVCAFIIKKLYFGRHSTDREVSLMILMAYLSYITAELLNLSAILTVFFCGISMSHYTWHNVTENSRVTTKHAFATLSFIAEIFIFLYVGMDALDMEKWRSVRNSPGTSAGASSILLGLVLVGRAAFVFPLSFISNLIKNSPSDRIGSKQQVVIWWAGLMRGSVSMALAYNKFTKSGHTQLLGNAILITSTITVVLFSTVVFGMMTKPLMRKLLPEKRSSSLLPSEAADLKSISSPLLSNGNGKDEEHDARSESDNIARPTSLRMLLTAPTNSVHYYWRRFDDSIMRPVFGGSGILPYLPALPTEETLLY
ncbi:sodium/hydrogen exchanger 1-like isoform X2 [Mercurialis annua]|nr:sodium/hydrogen exchanger 1-like isoform X2 [Mercurialis annua]